jgi:hypothetical protein
MQNVYSEHLIRLGVGRNLCFGGSAGEGFFTGTIADFRVYTNCLRGDQVSDLYHKYYGQ